MLRDPRVVRFGADSLAEIQRRIRDPNWRIFAEGGKIVVMNKEQLRSDTDPFVLFEQMGVTEPAHAFYLGYEMMKAKTALTLSKNYRQDRAMDWGFLTEPEPSHPTANVSKPHRAENQVEKLGAGEDLGRKRRGSRVILEGIVTTLNHDATLNIAPMGPRVDPATNLARFELRPYRSSTTYQNLKARGEGVFHVTDDVLLLAQTAIGVAASPTPATRPADVVAGRILLDACRYYEFRVVELDDRDERATIVAETAAPGRLRDFFGFNRARHAVLEAAILATRTEFLALDGDARRVPEARCSGRQDWGSEESARRSRSCTATFAMRPCARVLNRTQAGPRSMSESIQIRTPSRLHFGLFGWGPEVVRQFGGIGLMIESPSLELSVERAARGSSRDRWRAGSRQSSPGFVSVYSNAAACCPRLESASAVHRRSTRDSESGTQLSLAVARGLLHLAGFPDPGPTGLARLTGRGSRSGIGLHGFQHGGLIVDGGRKREGDIPPLLARASFPEEWSILIVQPPGVGGLHGSDESYAFSKLPPISRDAVDALCRLVLLEILPAVLEHDLEAFGAGLGELQERVGAAFAPRTRRNLRHPAGCGSS